MILKTSIKSKTEIILKKFQDPPLDNAGEKNNGSKDSKFVE